MSDHYEVLIVGGGTAGLTVASQLVDVDEPPKVAVVEPSDKHYYQPLWTLVGGGVFPREVTERNEDDVMPYGVTRIRDAVSSFAPDDRIVVTREGTKLSYDYLVVAAGIQINWGKIPGLKETVGSQQVCSNYSYDSVEYTWETIRGFRKGRAVFTHPAGAVKCGGAPQKIMYLAEHHFRRSGLRDDVEVSFYGAPDRIFAVDKYATALERIIAERDIDAHYCRNLIELKPDEKQAIFEHVETGEKETVDYDMIHVTPPMGAPDFIAKSPLANADGWVDVDKHSLRHVRYPTVFSLGDCSSLPTSKTGAAVRKQAPVLVENLLAARAGKRPTASYDGYTSCPLVTGYGRLILAEFDYDKQPTESFPFDQSEERYSMYALKAYGLPRIYWHGMLRGRV